MGRRRIQPDWWSKSSAGLICGLFLAVGCVGLFAWLTPGGPQAPDKVQLNMWLIVPLWMTIFSLVFLFHTGRQAWCWLGIGALLTHLLLLWFRHGGMH